MALPTMQKVSKDPYQPHGGNLVDEVGGRLVQDKPETLSVEERQKRYGTKKYRVETTGGVYEVQAKDSLVPEPLDWETVSERDEQGGIWLFPAHPLLKRNSDGVERVHFDSAKRVAGVLLARGELVSRTDLPGLGAYLMLFAYPLLGFLLPWGGIRVLTWVGSGFMETP